MTARRGHGRAAARPLPAHADLRARRRCSSCAARAPGCGTTTGTRYLDFLSGLAVTGLGHSHPAVADALARAGPDAAARLEPLRHRARARGGRAPSTGCSATAGGGQVFFCNSGAEANECAIKLARKFGRPRPPRRGQRLRLVPRPHPRHPPRHRPARQARGVPAAARGLPPRRLGRPRRARGGPRPVGRRRAARAGAGRGRREPGRPPSTSRACAGCATSGASCSWSTRCRPASAAPGAWFGFQHFGVVPDVVTMAKALGNGVPIGACWAKAEVAAAFEPGDHATTYGGQPLATAAARAVLGDDGGRGRARPGPRGPAPGSPTALAGAARRRRRCGASACSSPSSSTGLDAKDVAAGLPRRRARRQRRHAHRAAPRPVAARSPTTRSTRPSPSSATVLGGVTP